MSREGHAVTLTTSRATLPSTGADISRELPAALPPDQIAALAYFDSAQHVWRPVKTTLSANRHALSAHVTHLSTWDTIYYWLGKLLTERQDPPSCGQQPTWLKDKVYLDDRNAPLLWCAGREKNHPDTLAVKVVNNRAYGMALRPTHWPQSVSTSYSGGWSDLLEAGVSRTMTLPDALMGALQGVVFIPPGSTVEFRFDEATIRDAPDGLVVDASVELNYVIGGLIYHVVHDLAQDGAYGTGAFVLFLLIDLQQCAHDVGTGSLSDRAVGLVRCGAENADSARKTFIDVAAEVRPNLSTKAIAGAAVRFQEALMVIEAARIGAQIGEAISDARLVKEARQFHAYAVPHVSAFAPYAKQWYRHGENLQIRLNGKGLHTYRTYSELADGNMYYEYDTMRFELSLNGNALYGTVTKTRYDDGSGHPVPTPAEHAHPGDTYTYRLKSTGALNVHAGRSPSMSVDDLAYCRTGVDDHQCGA